MDFEQIIEEFIGKHKIGAYVTLDNTQLMMSCLCGDHFAGHTSANIHLLDQFVKFCETV